MRFHAGAWERGKHSRLSVFSQNDKNYSARQVSSLMESQGSEEGVGKQRHLTRSTELLIWYQIKHDSHGLE